MSFPERIPGLGKQIDEEKPRQRRTVQVSHPQVPRGRKEVQELLTETRGSEQDRFARTGVFATQTEIWGSHRESVSHGADRSSQRCCLR